MPLTSKQDRFFELLKLYFERHGKAPSTEELKFWLEANGWEEIKSLRSISQYLDALESAGKIRRDSNKHRGISLLESSDLVSIPLLASPVACGTPHTFIEEAAIDFIPVSRRLATRSENYYLFATEGDSMNLAGIDSGDNVLIEQTNDIRDGDLVLAVINGAGTIKKFRQTAETISLLPQSTNANHKPIYLHQSDDFMIAGKVRHIFKH